MQVLTHFPMQTGRPRPFISQKNVRQALDSLVYSTPHLDTPLLYLLLVEEFLLNPDLPAIDNPREYALAHILVTTITTEFTRQRQIFKIALPEIDLSRENIRILIENDAKSASAEMIGWSWLYHHFVRVDLNFSPQEFCDLVHIDERTLRRYQNHISKRLTVLLADDEWQTRILHRKRRLYSELPVSNVFPIMGRAGIIGKVLKTLNELHSAHFQIMGVKGMGKTALVTNVLQTQIAADNVDQLIWIGRPSSREFVRRLLLERLLPPQSQVGLREFLQMHKTFIVLDDAELLYEDMEGLYELLSLLSDAAVFITSNIHAPLLNTFRTDLKELDRGTAFDLIRYFFNAVNDNEQVDDDIVDLIHKYIGGNPLALQLTISNWSPINIDALSSNIGLDTIFKYLFESLEDDLKYAWIAFAIVSPGVIDYGELRHIWTPYFTPQTVDQLLRRHLLQNASDHAGKYSLIDSACTYIRERYDKDFQLRQMVETLVAMLEESNTTNVIYIENILTSDWLGMEQARRNQWVEAWWRIGLSNHHWSNWCSLLEANAKSDAPEIDRAIGYASCLRHLGETAAARNYLHRLVEITGGKGDFKNQAIAMTELAIVERQMGAYESADSWLARAEHTADRYKLDFLYEKLVIEQAQIAVDIQDIERFAQLIALMPHNPRAELLKSEIFLLIDDIESSRHIAETLLPLPELEFITRARVHDILGRIYEKLGDLEQAEEHFSWSLMIIEKNDDSFAIARAQTNLGSILLRLKHFEEAGILLINAENQQLLLRDMVGLATTQHNLRQLEIAIATS
ncbi:MAG: tetratricopeptide repeat protein [Chloroflexota bacterium]